MDACVVVNFLLKTDGVVDGDSAWGDDAGVDAHVLVEVSYHVTQDCTVFGDVVINATGDHDAAWTWIEKLNACRTDGCCFAFPCEFRMAGLCGVNDNAGAKTLDVNV